jgi:hypothetical protein
LPPRKTSRDAYKLDDADRERLAQLIKAKPDMTLAELAQTLATRRACRPSGVRRGAGIRLKKTLHAAEQDWPDVKAARDEWHGLLAGVRPGQLVFLSTSSARRPT